MATVERITLEDQGQDFTEWYVRDGIVIDCQPSQGTYWVGCKLIFPEGKLKAGSTVYLYGPGSGKPMDLKYKAKAVDVLSDAEALVVEGYGRAWAELKNIPASKLGL
jgi:hypothetical protein